MSDHPAADWIAHHARHTPEALAMVDMASDRRFTYAELDHRAEALAAFLAAEMGVGPCDRIAILSQNNSNQFEVQFACWRLGAAYVPLNWRLARPELEFILRDCMPRVLFHDAGYADVAAAVADATGISQRIVWMGAAASTVEYEQALASGAGRGYRRHDNLHSTLACVMYTSGTTGHPKGAMLTHGSMLWNTLNATAPWRFGEGMVTLTVLPLFHIGGINAFANPAFHYGGTSYIMQGFEPTATLQTLGDVDLGITHFIAVPTMWLFMSQQPAFAQAAFPTLTTAGVGGSPTPVPLLETWAAKGVILQQGYGMTESSATITVQSRADAVSKIGSVGTPLMHLETRIVDPEGQEVAQGEIGELWVRGPNICPGYWNRPEANEASYTDGFLHTGDAVREDAEGNLYIVDRWKDMYISGGENVYPAEVENVIYGLNGIGEVAVIGVPDEQWGEIGHAVIVLKPGANVDEAAVLRHCNEQLARYKVPRRVVFVDELPHNATGKLLKRALRDAHLPPAD